MRRIGAAAVILIPIVVLAYGYWFGRTHGALYISVLDLSNAGRVEDVKPVRLSFLDVNGRFLAEASTSEPFGGISVSAPADYSCQEIERQTVQSTGLQQQWASCFERQSRWLPGWVRDARSVDVWLKSCTLQHLPVAVSEHPDTWWLWWVPLRHIGGKPYTSFSFTVQLDRRACV
jgi:hypothetical protein